MDCVDVLTRATIARGATSLAMDVIMFIIPIPVIMKLHMPFRRRIGLSLVFMTGFVYVYEPLVSCLGLGVTARWLIMIPYVKRDCGQRLGPVLPDHPECHDLYEFRKRAACNVRL